MNSLLLPSFLTQHPLCWMHVCRDSENGYVVTNLLFLQLENLLLHFSDLSVHAVHALDQLFLGQFGGRRVLLFYHVKSVSSCWWGLDFDSKLRLLAKNEKGSLSWQETTEEVRSSHVMKKGVWKYESAVNHGKVHLTKFVSAGTKTSETNWLLSLEECLQRNRAHLFDLHSGS